MAASFSPWNLWPLGFVSWVPLWVCFERDRPGWPRCLVWGVWMACSATLLGFPWLEPMIQRSFGVGAVAGWGLALLVGFLLHVRFPIFLVAAALWRDRHPGWRGSRLVHEPWLAYTACWGWAELLGWQIFPVYGANLVSADSYFLQSIDLVGLPSLSLLWFAVNWCFYRLLCRARERWMAGILLLWALAHVYGWAAHRYWNQAQSQWHRVRVGVVQGNIASSGSRSALLSMLALSRRLTSPSRLDLLVWPESSVPHASLGEGPVWRNEMDALQAAAGCQILLHQNERVGGQEFNSATFLAGGGQADSSYHKMLLMPVGEVVPFKLPGLPRPHLARGQEPFLFHARLGEVMPLICYEAVRPDFCRNSFLATGRHAQMLVNLGNDASFEDPREARQSFDLMRLRAIELRLPLVRAFNSGISALVEASGDVQSPIEPGVRDVRSYSVALPGHSATLFGWWGNLLRNLFVWGNLGLWLVAWRRRERGKLVVLRTSL